MDRFWMIICVILLAIFVAIAMLPGAATYEPPLAVVLPRYALLGSSVGVIWAICFRKQVESFRFSIFSLFVLVTMEAILLTVARIMSPH
jgi:hypothetical protein